MPTTINGIGTWYYGKKRIHRHKGTCEFCQNVVELESYDTTLFLVFVFIPLIPLARKRILNQCARCQKHRLISLRAWETLKAKHEAELVDRLKENVDDRDTILHGLGLAMGYQDEELFNKLASSLAEHRHDDPLIQAQVGDGYNYFARYQEAEAAYRASLAAENTPQVQRKLAMVLLKQGRPEDAVPFLMPILENKEAEDAGLLFYLVEGLQAQGLHSEALDLMKLRDETFPEVAQLDIYKKQRKLSERFQHSNKKVRSVYLSESRKVGYRKGGWTASLPMILGPIVLAGLLLIYLISALWIGQSRKIYLVNGWDRQYTVAVNGRPQVLAPGATPVRVPEGEVTVELRDPALKGEPIHCRVETNFFGRPFFSHVFAINPDRLGILVRESTEYAEVPKPVVNPVQHYWGDVQYHFTGIDYEFASFPANLQIDKGSTVTKTRVAVEPVMPGEARLRLILSALNNEQQKEYIRRVLQLDPDNALFLAWYLKPLPAEEALAFIKPNLAVRPVLIENHRYYQHLMDKKHPERDLRPEYEKLVEESNRAPDAVYLLARVLDGAESEKLLEEAAGAAKPSLHAIHSLGWRALAQGQFNDAMRWLEQARQQAPGNTWVRNDYRNALGATRQFDRLLQEIERSGGAGADQTSKAFDRLRVYAARGDVPKARAAIDAGMATFAGMNNAEIRKLVKASLEQVLCCGTKDVAGFLQFANQTPALAGFEAALLRGQLSEAAKLGLDLQDEGKAQACRGLVYLAARKAKDRKLADEQWKELLAALGAGSRYDRKLGEMLAGQQPISAEAVRDLLVDPEQKRVLLVVAARQYPELGNEVLELARKLDFQCDAISLCLTKLRD